METLGEFTYSVDEVAQALLNNRLINKTTVTQEPHLLNQYNRIHNKMLNTKPDLIYDIKAFASQILTDVVEAANKEGFQSRITIPYSIAWGVRNKDWVFENRGETIRYLLDQAIDQSLLAYTEVISNLQRDLHYKIYPISGIKQQIAITNTDLERLKNIQNKLRSKKPILSSQERL